MNLQKLKAFTIYLTNDCNLRCLHCWVNGGTKFNYLDYEYVFKMIDETYEMGVRDYLLTGGEPFMHPKIDNIILYILEKKDANLSIETNGILLEADKIKGYSNYKLISFNISLDGPNADIHDLIRGSGAFNKTIENLLRLVSAGIISQCIMAVSKLNYNYIEETISFCASVKVPSIRIIPVAPCGRGEDMKKRKNILDSDNIIDLYNEMQTMQEKYKDKINVRMPIPPVFLKIKNLKEYVNECGFQNRLTLLANGRFSICGIGEAHEDFQFGISGETSVCSCWRTDEKLNQIISNTKQLKFPCSKCIYTKVCKGFCQAEAISLPFTNNNSYRICEDAYKNGLFPHNALLSVNL